MEIKKLAHPTPKDLTCGSYRKCFKAKYISALRDIPHFCQHSILERTNRVLACEPLGLGLPNRNRSSLWDFSGRNTASSLWPDCIKKKIRQVPSNSTHPTQIHRCAPNAGKSTSTNSGFPGFKGQVNR